MPRVKRGSARRNKRKKVLKLTKGFFLGKSKLYRFAKEASIRAGQNAFEGRKQKKRDFRKLWITRISAGCKMNGMNYSTFMHGLKLTGIDMNRKMLSETAIYDPEAFTALTETAKKALKA